MRTLIALAASVALSAAVTGAMAQDGETTPAPAEASASVAAPAPAKPIQTMKFSQQQNIVQPSEIRIGPGIACRMDGTVLACSATLLEPLPRDAK